MPTELPERKRQANSISIAMTIVGVSFIMYGIYSLSIGLGNIVTGLAWVYWAILIQVKVDQKKSVDKPTDPKL